MASMLIVISIAQDCMTSKWKRGHLNSYLTDSKTNTNDSTYWELTMCQYYYVKALHILTQSTVLISLWGRYYIIPTI